MRYANHAHARRMPKDDFSCEDVIINQPGDCRRSYLSRGKLWNSPRLWTGCCSILPVHWNGAGGDAGERGPIRLSESGKTPIKPRKLKRAICPPCFLEPNLCGAEHTSSLAGANEGSGDSEVGNDFSSKRGTPSSPRTPPDPNASENEKAPPGEETGRDKTEPGVLDIPAS